MVDNDVFDCEGDVVIDSDVFNVPNFSNRDAVLNGDVINDDSADNTDGGVIVASVVGVLAAQVPQIRHVNQHDLHDPCEGHSV